MRYFYITAISLITIIAIGLRIYPYTIGRSLWLDEAALANNLLLEHTILNNMTYGQAAPPLFKLVSIMNIKILGMTEAALRLFPLVCGIISIGLFYLISRKILNSKLVQTTAFLLFAINNYLIYYSSELKQYNSDMLLVLILIYVLIYHPVDTKSKRYFFILGSIYSICIWLSHFLLFMCPVTLIYFCFKKISYKKQLLFICPFIISFVLYYILHLQFVSHSEFMNNYWEYAFLTSNQAWSHGLDNFIKLAFFPIKISAPVIFLIICGIIKSFEQQTTYAILYVMPICCVLTAAALSLYPFAPRLCLPLIPLCIIFICKSFDNDKTKITVAQILCGVLFVVSFLPYVTKYPAIILKKNIYYREEIKPLLLTIKKHIQEGDKLYLMQDTHHSFRFYNKTFNFKDDDVLIAPYNENFETYYTAPLERMTQKNKKYWIVFTQYFGKEVRLKKLENWLLENTRIIRFYHFYGNCLFYIERI